MRTAGIIQARAGSTRLPGKIFKDLGGKPLLAHVIGRIKQSSRLDEVVLATTEKTEDDATAALGVAAGANVFRGSEADVLDRFYQAAKEAQADIVVRITGDCPMHSGEAVDRVIEHFIQSGAEYCAGPTDAPEGLDTEVFTFAALERAAREATLPSEREHVTLYFRNHPELFKLAPAWKVGGVDHSSLHLSVDTPEDFAFAEKIFNELGADFSTDEVIALLDRRPELRAINAGNTGFEGLHKSLKEDEDWKLMRRLVLGTVQLGMAYGVDAVSQPTIEEAYAILDEAFAAGIRTFDTASAYGSAEEVLGSWLAARGHSDKVEIISKGSGRADLELSLQRLDLKRLEGYLLHNNMGSVEELQDSQRLGLVKHIGASVYSPDEIQSWFEYVQIPYNALDRRFEKLQGTVFARSPFLQGVLLMDPSALPQHLVTARPHLEGFIAVARRFNLSQLQAAILFALHGNTDHRVVFGVKTVEQLREIIAAARTPLPEGFLEAVRNLPIPSREIVDPSQWKK